MSDLVFVVGIGGILLVAGVDKFCEVFGFKNAAGFLKITLPITALVAVGWALL